MGVQEIIYVLVGLLLAFSCWLLIRFFMLRSRTAKLVPPSSLESAIEGTETIGGEILGGEPSRTSSSVSFDSAALDAYESGGTRRRVRPAPEPDGSSFGFDALLEVRQMHHTIDELRSEVLAQRREIDELKKALAEVRAASQVSPLYSEAVALANRGYDAMAIAERCGISVAEAELVRSLSQDTAK